MSDLSWLNPTPHAIAVYASQPLSPVATQHSLPSGRYSLLGPDFHRQDRAHFAWRTHSITSSARASGDGGTSRVASSALFPLNNVSAVITSPPARCWINVEKTLSKSRSVLATRTWIVCSPRVRAAACACLNSISTL